MESHNIQRKFGEIFIKYSMLYFNNYMDETK